MKITKAARLIGLSLAWLTGLSLLLAACGDSTPTPATSAAATGATTTGSSASPAASGPPLSLTFALDFLPDTFHTGLFVAQQKGYFKEEGVDVTILPSSQGVFSSVLVASGKADVSFAGPEEILGAVAAGAPLVSVATIYPHNDTALVSRKDAGLTSPKLLEGKKYAAYGAPFETPMVTTMIKADGGASGNFQNITVGPQAIDAVVNKQADFTWIQTNWQGVQQQLAGVELNAIPVTKFGVPEQPTMYCFTAQPLLATKGEAIRRFLKALSRGYDFTASQPKAAADLLIASQPKGTFANADLIYKSQDLISGRLKVAGQSWGLQTQQAWTDYPKFLFNNKALFDKDSKPLAQELDYTKLFTNDYLPK